MSLNRVLLTGRLTKDPEVKATQSGSSIAKFTIAISNFYKGEEKTSFIDCTGFGKTAELLRDYFKKGLPIGIDGTLHQETWESKEGEKRSKLVIYCERVDFIGGSSKKEDKVKPEASVEQKTDTHQENYDSDLGF